MDYQTIDFSVRDRVATIRLNRPDKGNAMNSRMHLELHSIWDRINNDEDIWVAVLTGAGDVFSVGDDLEELAGYAGRDERPPRWNELIAWQKRFQGIDGASGIPEPAEGRPAKPLIAAINGPCFGPAMLLAAHSDFALAADTATFALPQVAYGLAPIDEAIALTRLTMRPAMMRMALLGDRETLSAERARELGLVLETRPASELMDRVGELVSIITEWSSPLAVRGVKAAIWKTIDMPWEDAHRWGRMYLHEVRFHSVDSKEGPRAFAEKRKPRWQAR